MNQSNQQSNIEELSANAEMAVALFAQAIGEDYSDFESRIVADFRRYQESSKEPSTRLRCSMAEYIEASGRGVAREIVELNREALYNRRDA